MCISDSDFDVERQFPLKAVDFDYDFYCHVTETSPGNSQINARSHLALGCWVCDQMTWVEGLKG